MNYKYLFIYLFAVNFFSEAIFAQKLDRLSHICAYSNESVAKFRAASLKKKSLDNKDFHGVHFDWPVDLCQFWISSLFGYRVNKSGLRQMHKGVDMAAIKGTKVKAAAHGVVSSVQKNMAGYGNLIEITHAHGLVTRYAHLNSIDVVEGQRVKVGQIIGTVGATGNVRGADPSHLHFELLKNSHHIDPLRCLYCSERNYKKLKKNVY